MMSTLPRFSLIVPFFEEQDNIAPLLDEVASSLVAHGPFEMVAVDDASGDETVARLKAWRASHDADWLRIVQLKENRGQSCAICAGVDVAKAPIVATLDGDLQNDPHDLPAMIARIESGECDGVTGVRADRKDTWVRRQSSKIGNGFRNFVTGDKIADSGCGIKAYKRADFLGVPRFNGMHRFMATLVRYRGRTVIEVPVNHRPRVAGVAKYGIGNRLWRGIKDCLAVRWMRTRVLEYEQSEVK